MMLIMVLSYTGFRLWEGKHAPPAVVQTSQKPAPNAGAVAPGVGPATQSGSAASAAPAAASALPVIAAQAETTSTIENELYRITFSNRGAQATSWVLKRYKDSHGQPLDLVNHQAAKVAGYPLSLYTYDPAVTASLANAMYVASATGNVTAPGKLTFQYQSGEWQVTKTFAFDQSYVLQVETKVLRNGVPVRALLAWPGGFGDQDSAAAYGNDQIESSSDGKEEHLAAKKVSGGDTLHGPFDWAGVSDLYFAAIFLPDSPGSATLVTLDTSLDAVKSVGGGGRGGNGEPVKADANGHVDTVKVPLLGAAMGDLSGDSRVSVFAGPKAVDVLKNIHAENPKVTLEPLLDFGFFGIIGKYLFLALRAIHEHVTPSWGWSIVILTVLINLLILPLRIKTMQSGLKMQRIQPQIEAIKAKYKNPKMNDPKFNEMNAEVMQFQKDSGVNMFGGCVPTLITMPLLFAFFGMLPKVVELRQAHWYWLPDLSSADPYHILPILMMVSQFVVQFYTPSPGIDPAQQRMMAFMMPAFSGIMTWHYSSGLALYWSVGNLIGIGQQAVMNRTSLGREMREIAAKRARRKAGMGVGKTGAPVKTIQGKTGKRR
jgi:YidC/Oxa1 family membrane protein insertase